MTRSHWWRIRAVLLVAACLAISSCGPGRPRLYPVRGQVLFHNRPAEGATVILQPLDNSDPSAPRPSGEVGSDGWFTLSTFAPGDGAPAGDYVAVVVWFDKNAVPDPDTGEIRNRLSEIYSSSSSPLRVTVKEEATELAPFNVE
jgi:hypothetical protein